MLKEKKRPCEIAEELACSKRTVEREIKRGQVQQLEGSTWLYKKVYSADVAQNDYGSKRGGGGPGLKIGHDHKLCEEIESQIRKKRSPDVIAQDIGKRIGEFQITLCTRTIYNYLEKNIFLTVNYKDLVYGHYQKKSGTPVNRPSYKNIRGRSIEDRPSEVNERSEAGHWERDAVALVFLP
jgi:IS30 family transposase